MGSQQEVDYLILGSGLSALSFAALMAKNGKRVHIVEAHEVAGGYGHTFVEGNKYRFNAQLHYVWNCGEGQLVNRFLKTIGLDQEVTFGKYDPQGFDHMRMPGYALDIPCDYDELYNRLAKLFPRNKNNLGKLILDIKEMSEVLGSFSQINPLMLAKNAAKFFRLARWRKATLQQVFDHYAIVKEAQTLLALQWPDFMLPPQKLSYIAWVLLFSGYCSGAYYPTKHFEHVIDSLTSYITSHDGEITYNHKATNFILTNGVMGGAIIEDLTKTKSKKEILAKNVVCNFDPQQAARMIGFDKFSATIKKKLLYDYSLSNFMVYAAVDGIDLRNYGFGKWNIFHSEQSDLNQAFHQMHDLGDYSKLSFGMTSPTLQTSLASDAPPKQQIIEMITVANYQRFQEAKLMDRRRYVDMKLDILNHMLDVAERCYIPNLRKHLVFKMTGSPTTNERYCWSPFGNSYGSNMTPQNMGLGRLSYSSSIKNFYFCNASSGYGGFAGTIWTGVRLYKALSGQDIA